MTIAIYQQSVLKHYFALMDYVNAIELITGPERTAQQVRCRGLKFYAFRF